MRITSAGRNQIYRSMGIHQVQEGIARIRVENETGGDGDGFFEHLRIIDVRIEDQRLAHEVLVLKFLDHGFVAFCAGGPMNLSHGVAITVVAK